MAVSDISTGVSGLTVNPGLMINAIDYIAEGAQRVANSDAIGDYYVGVDHAGQKIMETPWYSGIFRDNVQLRCCFKSNASSRSKMINITVYSRQPGSSEYTATDLYVQYDSAMSPSTGTPPTMTNLDSRSTDYLQFDPTYEYKFVVSCADMSDGTYLYFDYMFCSFIPRGSILNPNEQGYFIDPLNSSISYKLEPITVTETCNWSIAIDTYGNGHTTFDRVAAGDANTNNMCIGYYKRIDHVSCTMNYNAAIMTNNKYVTLMVTTTGLASDTTSVTPTSGSYVPVIYATSNISSATTITGTCQITGKVIPKDIPG